ncbi:hypothetical protein ASPTUDRAFT_49186 [Aspergillus tubingensis CBS 134.48]|uniref:Uncharacterized protein n=1 Tax=Aspergillus tubingensis (strain CBS 134.48) TaxID=767770 RepID=A0A1L9NJR5_ASPTC|nr:hypothetical protein ASPTUDRAFT_49186 [Aspergillus tubingensis CBS 134.48]
MLGQVQTSLCWAWTPLTHIQARMMSLSRPVTGREHGRKDTTDTAILAHQMLPANARHKAMSESWTMAWWLFVHVDMFLVTWHLQES